jgi:hypothetical protein
LGEIVVRAPIVDGMAMRADPTFHPYTAKALRIIEEALIRTATPLRPRAPS